MPISVRKLTIETNTEEEEQLAINCVNGYLLENSPLCICYPGWTSDSYSLDQCTIDTGENNTNTNTNTNKNIENGIIYVDNETKENNKSFNLIIIMGILGIFFLVIFCYLFLCFYKKCKDIRLVKEKIKFEKKKNKALSTNINKIAKKGKDINSTTSTDDNQDSIYLGVLCENNVKSYREMEDKE